MINIFLNRIKITKIIIFRLLTIIFHWAILYKLIVKLFLYLIKVYFVINLYLTFVHHKILICISLFMLFQKPFGVYCNKYIKPTSKFMKTC